MNSDNGDEYAAHLLLHAIPWFVEVMLQDGIYWVHTLKNNHISRLFIQRLLRSWPANEMGDYTVWAARQRNLCKEKIETFHASDADELLTLRFALLKEEGESAQKEMTNQHLQREMDSLREEIDSLRSMVDYLKQQNSSSAASRRDGAPVVFPSLLERDNILLEGANEQQQQQHQHQQQQQHQQQRQQRQQRQQQQQLQRQQQQQQQQQQLLPTVTVTAPAAPVQAQRRFLRNGNNPDKGTVLPLGKYKTVTYLANMYASHKHAEVLSKRIEVAMQERGSKSSMNVNISKLRRIHKFLDEFELQGRGVEELLGRRVAAAMEIDQKYNIGEEIGNITISQFYAKLAKGEYGSQYAGTKRRKL